MTLVLLNSPIKRGVAAPSVKATILIKPPHREGGKAAYYYHLRRQGGILYYLDYGSNATIVRGSRFPTFSIRGICPLSISKRFGNQHFTIDFGDTDPHSMD